MILEKAEFGMKSADFKSELSPTGQIDVPPEIAAQVSPGEAIEVVLRWGVSDVEDDTTWRAAGRRQFEAAYARDDSIYELLNHDSSTR